ncbi:uncharacterized protein LOC119012995 isoform X1 [Acanthopagrus latus]|uniref:uncharacterized protein LOC119012995 isoform X1 n=1 Tax=Acanthopagrus latus TaxID=8177 RepID=UPI00187BF724|nr:uncharacterized protein LOC119012995 isoform X1 [Acanthopagrus latus]XP_036943173.1 uncharacterized protein LOC119012995 isoform X1 [Acanthopagrus latus]XP_036943175.1 uncharacterized protein LOC119012995 isoform X1 [Acanthopagrus latus]XP_036943176.1 uncharacterized protein LOC119012995 isoform X1 [Acanthopagrus latus]
MVTESTMSAFRGIQTCLLLLHLTAVTGRYTSFVVRDGDGVTLPCENATYNQNGCEHTSWLFSGAGNTSPVELVTLGQVGERARAKSDQLGVEENCALVLKKVKVEDVGRYSCRQVNESRQQQGPDAHVYLSVIIRSEHEDGDMVTLSCSVTTYGWCTQRVKWLFKGQGITDVRTRQAYCSTSVTFKTFHYIHTSGPGSLACEATDVYTGRVQVFTFGPQSSGEDVTTVRTTEESPESASAADDATFQDWWRYVIVSVGLALLITFVVVVNMWTRAKGSKTEIVENVGNNYEDNGMEDYENI